MEPIEIPVLGGDAWVAATEDNENGVHLPTPFDGLLPPLVKGRATFLGGPTGGGKTALALQIYRHVVDAGHASVFVTLEMTPADLFERFARQFEDEQECKDWIVESGASVSESYISPKEIEQLIKSKEYDFVVVDHIHEFPYTDRRDLEQEVSRIAALAPSEGVAILALAQLRRPDPQFPRPPSKHDFRETGVIEQKGAVVLALYQEDEHSNYSQIYTLKNRFGGKYDPLDVYLDERTVTFRPAL